MVDIKFNCPSCNQSLEAPPDMGGQQIDCPTCKNKMQIPGSQPVFRNADETKKIRPSMRREVLTSAGVALLLLLVVVIARYTDKGQEGLNSESPLAGYQSTHPALETAAPEPSAESEINKLVDTILTAWNKGGVSYNDEYFGGGRLLSPTEWQVRSIHVGVSGTDEVPKADVVVFVKSSNRAGIPIQLNWLFIFIKYSGTWQLVELQPSQW